MKVTIGGTVLETVTKITSKHNIKEIITEIKINGNYVITLGNAREIVAL